VKSQKERFCEFLANLSNGQLDRQAWNVYAVNHYEDQELELARVELVRTSNKLGRWEDVPDVLRVVALELLRRF
jgi:hypothetical protein